MRTSILRAVAAISAFAIEPNFAAAEQSEPSNNVSQEQGRSSSTSDKPIELDLMAGYGADTSESNNRWGFGLGGRAGYNFQRLYVGARFVYHFGDSYLVKASDARTVERDMSIWELGAEVGYDIPLSDELRLRPSMLLGIARYLVISAFLASAALAATAPPNYDWLISPGLAVAYDVSDNAFIGADVRVPIVGLEYSIIGITAYGSIGVRI